MHKPNTSQMSWLARLKDIFSKVPRDRQALIEILRSSENRNLLDPDVLTMIEGALQVSDMRVNDIMVPRVQMIFIKNNASPDEIVNIVVQSGHSRFPVIDNDANDVLGILLAKDLLSYFADTKKARFDIKDVMRPVIFIPESKRLNVLLQEFRANRNHMAIVVDEYGIAGLVTIEDVIEEIVGEIEDEHDIVEEDNIRQHGKNRYTVKALTPIDEFNEKFNTDLSDDEYDTIGGLIINAFGHLPKRGENIDFADFNIKVLRSDQRRIHLLRFARVEQQNDDLS
ncbi:MAG: CBS domain-containing protein [Gammaproteobacteria bacterium]|nr:CBS domain-containing protein [Gammaproteobacteria bacterium]